MQFAVGVDNINRPMRIDTTSLTNTPDVLTDAPLNRLLHDGGCGTQAVSCEDLLRENKWKAGIRSSHF